MEERLAKAGALDPALAAQLEEAQRLLREAMTPEMAAALERLEGASSQLDADRTRQSLSELAAQQRRLREALAKSAELLQRAALEGSLQTLADRGQELAEAQQALADSLAQRATSPTDQARTEALARESRQLVANAEALSQRLEAAGANRGAEGTSQGAEAAQNSARAMDNATRDPAAAQQAAAEMNRAASELSDARREQVLEWRSELTATLDQAVQDLLQLARREDALADAVRAVRTVGAPAR